LILEYIINKFIISQPESLEFLATLNNKTLSITCSNWPDLTVYCVFSDTRINLTHTKPEHLDVIITAPLLGLIKLAINQQTTDLRAENIAIHGDILTAELIQKLLFNLNIDWEEELSKYTGDVIAHQAILLIKHLKAYNKDTSSSLLAMLTEYLQEEAKLLPTHFETDEFMQAVDQLRMQVDRLEARVNIYEGT